MPMAHQDRRVLEAQGRGEGLPASFTSKELTDLLSDGRRGICQPVMIARDVADLDLHREIFGLPFGSLPVPARGQVSEDLQRLGNLFFA